MTIKVIYITALVAVLVGCGTGSAGSADGNPDPETQAAQSTGSVESSTDEDGALVVSADAPEGGAGEYEAPELPADLQDQSPPPGAAGQFTTDFSRATISYDQVMSGGPPKDGIPSIDEPEFISVSQANSWMAEDESVQVVSVGSGEQRVTHIYPIQILMWHEIVNDSVAGRPVSVTYCPLCNTGIAFDRRFDGRTLDFGTTGRLRYSNLLMYDRQTETWWQQATGRGVAGAYAGGRLEMVPMLTLSWSDATDEYPDARVLSRDTGYSRSYGNNPYRGYDTADRPFLYSGPTDDEFSPMTRVVTVFHNDSSAAFPYPTLREERVVTTHIGGDSIAVFWQQGTASPLDSREIGEGRDVGTANAFFARADGRELSFDVENGDIVDEQTGSTWDVGGRATAGPLAGTRLEPVTTSQHFWFSWTAFEQESG